jgi:TonB family protein
MATQASDSIKQKSRTRPADELAVIAQRAQAFTNASGAAIAISEGNTDEIVCQARSGSSAPDVGISLRVEGTFTGLCIQSGKELRCDDAETDTRVDTVAIRALGIRSMVVTPIREDGKVTGVLAVFAPTPHAFTITHVAVLKTMADQISALLQKEPAAHETPIAHVAKDEPPVAVPVPVAAPKPARPAVPLPPPVVIRPAAPTAAAAAAAAPAKSMASPAPKIVDSQPLALAADIARPAPSPRREEKRERKPEPLSPKTSFGTLDAVAGEPSRPSAGKFIVIGGIVAIAVGGGWFYMRAHKSAAPAQTVQQPQNSPSAAPVTTNPASNPVTNENIAATTPVSTAPAPKPEISEKADSKKAEPKKKEQPAAEPTPATVAIGDAPSRISAAPPVDQSPDVAPSLAVGAGSGSSGLSSLARPVDSSAPSTLTTSELINAKPLHTVTADYPELAKSRGLSGMVVIKVTVGKDGKVRNPVFVSGPLIFRDSAFDAVKQWVFKPAQLNGQPIDQETEIRMNFHPGN